MQMPDFAEYWSVDEVIECLTFGPDRAKVETELLAAMPNAYGPRTETECPPEPDLDPQYKLARIWRKLSVDVQAAIVKAAQREGL